MNDERRLYVLRHAKSSWDNPAQEDHDRPLAPRGQRAVAALATYIANSEIRPQIVLCSSARRTRETLEGVGVGGAHRIERRFFELGCGGMLDELRALPADTESAMVVGHNPTMQRLVLKLTGGSATHNAGPSQQLVGEQLVEIERKFPTGALATLRFSCQWAELASGAAQLSEYVKPKALQFS